MTPKVSQNTSAMMPMKQGSAVNRPVSTRSMATLRLCSRLSPGFTTVSAQSFSIKVKRISARAASRSRPVSLSSSVMVWSSSSFSFWSRRSDSRMGRRPPPVWWKRTAAAARRRPRGLRSDGPRRGCSGVRRRAGRWRRPRRCRSRCGRAIHGDGPHAARVRSGRRMPSFLAAEMGTTGMPSAFSSSFTRMVPPLARTSSIMFSASTMGICNSINCMVR